MDINQIKDWLVPVSSFFALITVSVGAWLSLKEYRLKLKTEARLSDSARVEADVRLLALFTEIMNIAHGRRGSVVSEKAIENMFNKGILTQNDFSDFEKLKQKIETVSVLNLPVGLAAQIAAIAAIATLAKRHEVLREPAIEGLQSLSKHLKVASLVEVIQKYLNELQASE